MGGALAIAVLAILATVLLWRRRTVISQVLCGVCALFAVWMLILLGVGILFGVQ